jgi:hypothetical protein
MRKNMLTKIVGFLRSQRLITKVATAATLLSIVLALTALAKGSAVIMLVTAVITGLAAGFAISAWHHSPRRNNGEDRRTIPDRREENHTRPQLLAR